VGSLEESRKVVIRRGGRPVPGFGIGVGDAVEEFEKSQDPLYDCHHDTYTKLKTIGTAVVATAVTAGAILYAIPWLKSSGLHLPHMYDLHNGAQ
jgi:hypothetical protein